MSLTQSVDANRLQQTNAVIDKRCRGQGIGRMLAQCAMKLAFENGCKALYLGAELQEFDDKDPLTGERVFQHPKESGAYRFWKRLKFKRISEDEYNNLMEDDLEGFVPMKMTNRMKSCRDIPELCALVQKLLEKLNVISLHIDRKEREPCVRLCAPGFGDAKVTEKRCVL